MASSVGTVSIDLEARVAKLESDLGRAAMIADRKCKEIQDSFKTLAIGVAGYFSGKAIIDWLQSSIDAADEISKMSQKTGVATETLSGWTLAAKQAGVEQDALTSGLTKLAKAQDAAIGGDKKMQAAFAQVGLSVQQLKQMNPEQVVNTISDAFEKHGDGASKAALATQLFGKAGADLIPLLNAGSAGLKQYTEYAKAYGLVVSQEAAKAAEDFNDTMERITTFLGKGVANQITSQLAPALTSLASQLDKYFQSDSWANTLNNIAKAAKFVADNMDAIVEAVKLLAETWAAFIALNLVKNIGAAALAMWQLAAATDGATLSMRVFGTLYGSTVTGAVKQIGVLGVAFNVLGAAITGWQIGRYLSDQFLEVRLAGIALVDGLLVGWERIKQGADIAWAAIEYAFGVMADAIKKSFADTLTSIANGFSTIGANDASEKINAYAKSLTSGASAGDKFAKSVADINKRTDDNIKAIHQTTDEMAAYETQAEIAKKKAATIPKLDTGGDNKKAFDFSADTESANKAADAIKNLTDKVADLYAENLKTGDKVIDQQAQSLRALADQGAKAIEAGASVAAVQKLVAEGAEQIALTAQKARDAENKQFDDYIKQQQQKLQDDKDELALKVASSSMSDKEIAQAQQLLDISKDTTAEMRKLVDARDKGSMDQDEFDRRSAAIKDLEQQRVQATLDANHAIDVANADWLNGAVRATKNFLDQAANMAQQTSEIVTNAFSGFVDTFAQLLTTGKADFKSFALSVLSDLAKMETRVAMSKILSGILGGTTGTPFGWSGVAKGDVFNSPGIHALSGGIYNRPTRFFARGGNVLGEAGWEGVLPLKTNASGKLGVMAEGMGGNQNNVSVVVNIDNGGQSSTNAIGSDDQMKMLGNMIASKCKEVITSEQRPGGILWRPAHG
jgi:lambda family phage tail tape measure protein